MAEACRDWVLAVVVRDLVEEVAASLELAAQAAAMVGRELAGAKVARAQRICGRRDREADPAAEAERVAAESGVEAEQAAAMVSAPEDWELERVVVAERAGEAEQVLAPEAKAALRGDGWRLPR